MEHNYDLYIALPIKGFSKCDVLIRIEGKKKLTETLSKCQLLELGITCFIYYKRAFTLFLWKNLFGSYGFTKFSSFNFLVIISAITLPAWKP